MRVWIDIENPPQVQYLLPFRQAFVSVGVETVITARDYGSTLELLKAADAEAHTVWHEGRKGKAEEGGRRRRAGARAGALLPGVR